MLFIYIFYIEKGVEWIKENDWNKLKNQHKINQNERKSMDIDDDDDDENKDESIEANYCEMNYL